MLEIAESRAAEGDAALRYAAIRTLGKLEARELAPRLLPMLEDPDEDVRVAAAEALGRLGDPTTVSALIEHLDDPCRTVRRYAIISLGRLVDPRAVAAITDRIAREKVAERAEGVRAISAIGGAEARTALQRYAKDPNWWVRRKARQGL